MKFLDHIKLSAYIGLIVGILFGIIDIIAKIVVLNFEWFEFYLSLLTSSIVFITCFVILALSIELLKKIIKFKTSKKRLTVFYFTTIISFILLFYGEIFINKYLPLIIPFFSVTPLLKLGTSVNFVTSFVYGFIILLVYILLLIKGKNLLSRLVSYIKESKINRLIKNCILIVIIFVIISFFMDLYLLNDVTTPFVTKEELKDYPNILLIVLDAVRADHLSLYGYPLNTTPNLDKFAKNAVIFDNVVSSSSWTLPSHASIFTGKYPFRHNAVKNYQRLDSKETTLAEILKSKGYNTAGFIGSDYFLNAKFGSGQGFLTYKDRLDFFEYASSFDRFSITNIMYMFFPNIFKFITNADAKRTAEEIHKDVFKWLDKNKQPFFMFINYYDAVFYETPPHKLSSEFKGRFNNESIDFKNIDRIIRLQDYEVLSENLMDSMISLYDAGIFYMDNHLKSLFDKLDELKILDNTIIIITADHGEEFYEHKGFTHAGTLYEESIHVPLIIYYPKEFNAKRIETRTGNINIFSTILDILKIEIPKDTDSTSLLPLIKNKQGYEKEYAFSELWGAAKSDLPKDETISNNDWKLIKKINKVGETSYELYNLKEDPKEQNNVYDKYLEELELLKMYMDNITKKI